MKVVQELVAYFDRRGRLGAGAMRRLAEQGLLAQEAPRTMQEHCGQVGRAWSFRVVGDAGGPVWGTDVYTGDSALGAAAVHAGLAAPGEAVVLHAIVVEPPERFAGSLRHGVTSRDYERFDSAYRLERVAPDA